MNRTRKHHRVYARYTKQAKSRDCAFCNFKVSENQVVKSTKYFWIVKNMFPYDVWDHTGVTEHLMLVPKRHIDAIGHFNLDEQLAFTKLVGQYDTKGYSIYARPKDSTVKSVAHQHTHLIKLDGRFKTIAFFLRKPRVFLYK